ncbi:MAG: MFS transporter [Anaerolineae bacterium]|nr:MFS transporter [Anaerolineae bacterium]
MGLISFFGGISQDLILPILPIYLSTVLHLDKSFIGLTEGLVTSSASIFKIVSGYLSDRIRSRKSIVFVGYLLSLIGRPLLALTTSSGVVLLLRFIDGVGKGIKDSPKDALIADTTDAATRGRSFGIARALDTLGSVVGPLILFAILYLLRDNDIKYHYVFFIAAIPLFFTLAILQIYVKETPLKEKTTSQIPSSILPRKFYIFLAIMIVFTLGNSSDTFLILRAQNVGVAVLAIPLVYALFNFFYAAASIPLGTLSDRIGREKVIIFGWLAYALAYLGFAIAAQTYQIWILFAFYGIYYATTEGVAKALIADLVVSEHRGKAYGIYNSVIGLIALPASVIAGFLWDAIGAPAPFFFGAAMAGIATILLLIFIRNFYPKTSPEVSG